MQLGTVEIGGQTFRMRAFYAPKAGERGEPRMLVKYAWPYVWHVPLGGHCHKTRVERWLTWAGDEVRP